MVTDNLRRRIDVSKHIFPVRNERAFRRNFHDDYRRTVTLEKSIGNLERRMEFMTDAMLGVVSAFFAVLGTLYAGGFDPDKMIAAALIAFLVATWTSNFLFPSMTRWCLK